MAPPHEYLFILFEEIDGGFRNDCFRLANHVGKAFVVTAACTKIVKYMMIFAQNTGNREYLMK